MQALLELKKLSFSTRAGTLVSEASIAYAPGRATALTGPSGSGKSTVLKLSAGLLTPDSGQVFYRGRDLSLMSRAENLEFRRESAFVFQDTALWSNQSLEQNLNLPLQLHFPQMSHRERLFRIKETLAEVGYTRTLDLRPAALSAGEQKLIGFARALLCRPSLLFLDEWTASLDDDAARRLVRVVEDFKNRGNTILFVSHDLSLIQSLADCVIMIKSGRVTTE
ncbi:MAG: ATP-binding cassette domain-containing protein [Treponema sp.]|jgi:ABC-type lipoprotein export system ATPase subunit|nr:ATP-binding cassette domain-containing protein [Treponema sp.]